MEKNNNPPQYLQVIPHYILFRVLHFFWVLHFFYYQHDMVDLMIYFFDVGRKYMPMYVSINVIIVGLEGLILTIPCWFGKVNTLNLIFVDYMQIMFLCLMKQTDRNI